MINKYMKNQKEYIRYLGIAVALGVIFYFSMLARDLVNNIDGIWHPSNFVAGDWEISLGRGLQRYADRARFGLVSSALNSVFVFLIIGAADVMLIKKCKLEDSFFAYLFILLTIVNPVTAESLSYSYMSVNFAFAYFFAVGAFCLTFTENYGRIFRLCLAIFSFAVSMSFYQAYICVFCVCCLYAILLALKDQKSVKDIFRYVVNCAVTFLGGGIAYMILTKILLWRAGIEMAGYRGASDISPITILTSLPTSIVDAYKEFGSYVFHTNLHANLEFSSLMTILLFTGLIGMLLFVIYRVCRKKLGYGIVMAAVFTLLPLASCIICLIAVGNAISGLMAMGILFFFLGFYILVKEEKVLRTIYLFLMALLAWFYIGAVVNDQIALKEGITATKTITRQILDDLHEEDLLEDGVSIAFVGRLAENPVFYKSVAYEMANGYAQFGRWSTDARNNRTTWIGILNSLCGVELPVCDVETYEEIRGMEEVERMPIYPEDGYMKVIGDVLVIKTSMLY